MSTSLEQACRDAGVPIRRQRRAILEVLSAAEDHPTAEDIYKRARALDPRINLATVYRTLSLLQARGMVFTFDFGDRKVRYEDAARGPHDHIIDADTGLIENCRDDELESVLRAFARSKGYDLRRYRLDLMCTPQTPARAKRAATD